MASVDWAKGGSVQFLKIQDRCMQSLCIPSAGQIWHKYDKIKLYRTPLTWKPSYTQLLSKGIIPHLWHHFLGTIGCRNFSQPRANISGEVFLLVQHVPALRRHSIYSMDDESRQGFWAHLCKLHGGLLSFPSVCDKNSYYIISHSWIVHVQYMYQKLRPMK